MCRIKSTGCARSLVSGFFSGAGAAARTNVARVLTATNPMVNLRHMVGNSSINGSYRPATVFVVTLCNSRCRLRPTLQYHKRRTILADLIGDPTVFRGSRDAVAGVQAGQNE